MSKGSDMFTAALKEMAKEGSLDRLAENLEGFNIYVKSAEFEEVREPGGNIFFADTQRFFAQNLRRTVKLELELLEPPGGRRIREDHPEYDFESSAEEIVGELPAPPKELPRGTE